MIRHDIQKDFGVMQALLHESSSVHLPRVLRIRKELAAGKRLDEKDVAFMHEVFKAAGHLKPFVDRHLEFQEFYAREIMLLHEITALALANELEPRVFN
jgi:hypothetical protein